MRNLLALLLAACAACLPVAAHADGYVQNTSNCMVPAPGSGDPVSLAQQLGDAVCPETSAEFSEERTMVRLDPASQIGDSGDGAWFFLSRVGMFERLTLVTHDATGEWHSATYPFNAMRGTFFDRQFYAPLPRGDAPPQMVYAVFDKPTQRVLFDFAAVAETLPGNTAAERNTLIVIALAIGMIFMALIFDIAFFRILRRKFIVWHGLFVSAMMVHLATSSGLSGVMFDQGLFSLRLLMVASFGLIVIAAMQFAIAFVEPGKLHRRHRHAIHAMSIAMAAATALHIAGFLSLGKLPANIFYTVGGMTGIAFLWIVIAALRNGSREILFPVLAFTPLILIAGFRVVTFLLPDVPTIDLNMAFIFAALMEIAITAIGVAHRFGGLRQERDRAMAEAETLERLAGHDPLTGLMNRRAVEPSFTQLYGDGFTSFALLDLDRFKSVNDQFGHATGDEVLKAVAEALAPDDRTYAIRMGGEEFMLLLRGDDARDRVEARRQAITRHVAQKVPGLDRPVTASVGFVQMPQSGGENFSFDATYAHIDRLLYEAKSTGRNRLVAERMTVFAGGKAPDRRKNERASAA